MAKRWIWLLVVSTLVVSLSCSLVAGSRESEGESVAVTVEVEPGEVEPGEAPTEPAVDELPEPVEEGDDDLLRIDRDGLEQLESYRAIFSWRLEKEDGTVESLSMEQAATRDPRAEQFTMTSDGSTFEMIRVEDQVWMGSGDDWMQTSADDDMEGFGEFIATSDDWVSDLQEGAYEYVGRDTVNGFRTRHYRTDTAGNWSALFGGDADSPDEVETAVAEIWIADEPDLPAFMVRFTLEMTGTFDGEQGTATMRQEVSEANQPITIVAPEGAAAGGLPEGVPLYPGAQDVASFGTMTMFSTGADVTVEEVHAFYEDALYAAGWEPNDEPFAYEGMMSSTWTMSEQQLSLTITSGDDDEGASVIIMLEELVE